MPRCRGLSPARTGKPREEGAPEGVPAAGTEPGGDASARRAAGAFLASSAPAAWLDPELRLAWASESFGRLAGAPAGTALEALRSEVGLRLAEAARALEPGGEGSLELPGKGGATVRLTLFRPRDGSGASGVLVLGAERGLAERAAGIAAERDESVARLDALFENAPVGVALLDLERRYLRVNAELARTNGASPAEHLGRGIWEVAPLLAREEVERDLAAVVAERKAILERPLVTQLRSATEPARSFLLTYFPVSAGERVTSVGMLWQEVTEELRAEQFQRHLLGAVGHDLRSPLMAITASAELMQSTVHGEREQRSLARILRAAQRIDGIIRALVDYTLAQVGSGIPLQRRRTELGAISRSVSEEAEAVHAGRRVKVVAPEPIPGHWDPDRLGQAVANLVENALDYSPPESTVEVRCRAEGNLGVVEVANEGAPISPELLPRLFEPFRRGSEERVQRRKGLGLGLYIARQIVLALGGSIEVRSQEGSGTVFALRLPRAAGEAAAPEGDGLSRA